MIIGRALGWLLIGVAFLCVGMELTSWVGGGGYEVLALGTIWAKINANSLVGFGAFVEKSISPALWRNVLVPILGVPAWLFFGLGGMGMVALFRKRKRHRYSLPIRNRRS